MTENIDTRAKRLEEIMNKNLELYKKKNADYGNSFAEVYKELGFESGLVQILHKVNRIKGIYSKGKAEVENESIRDSLVDLANYALMTVVEMELEENKEDELIKNIKTLGLYAKSDNRKIKIGTSDGCWDIGEINKASESNFKLFVRYWFLEADKAETLWGYILDYMIKNKEWLMDHKKLLERLGEEFQARENDKGFELYDTKRNLIATIKAKDDDIKYSINKGFNKLSRMTRRKVLYELYGFCQEEKKAWRTRWESAEFMINN